MRFPVIVYELLRPLLSRRGDSVAAVDVDVVNATIYLGYGLGEDANAISLWRSGWRCRTFVFVER